MTQAAASIPDLADRRFELAVRASRQERANRPTLLLVLAGVVLAGSLVYLAWAALASLRAERALAAEIRNTDNVLRMTAELKALEQAGKERGRSGVGDPIPDIFSRIQAAARDAGMATELRAPRQTSDPRPGMAGVVGKRFEYANVQEESLESILIWIDRATRAVPGLEVHTIALKPEPRAWTVRVVFRRWERTSGS